MEVRDKRRLAAVLAADVVGYSLLMGTDESGTLAQIKTHRKELIDPKVAEYNGNIVKTTGDGLLIEFPSVLDAVQCAVDVQRAIAQRNTHVPEDKRVRFRMGINQGDVIVEENDIYGDGINIASRLEGVAEPGGICISSKVHEDVRDKVGLRFNDLGEQTLKNIARPVQAFSIDLTSTSERRSTEATPLPLQDRPSIAVLPFDNMSGDPEQAYFSDGIAEDIITDLSGLSGLFVIARNSSFAYRGQSLDVRRVSQELGVNYVLEGSVRKAVNRVRVTAQLVEGESGGHLWANRYDRDLDDIFAIQDEITQNIVDALKVRLNLVERENIGAPTTSNLEAYDYVLRARSLIYRHERESSAEAAKLLEKALELDPGYITAYWGLAVVLFSAYTSGWSETSEATLERGYKLASTAVELDPNDAHGHFAMALAHLWSRDFDRAIEEIERAIALAPNSAEAFGTRGLILDYASQPAEAIKSLEKSMRLDPRHPSIWFHFLAHAHFILRNYEKAVELLKRRIRINPETDVSRALLASSYGHLNRNAEARNEWAKLFEINPNYSIEQKAKVLPYKNPADWDRFVEGLRLAGLRD